MDVSGEIQKPQEAFETVEFQPRVEQTSETHAQVDMGNTVPYVAETPVYDTAAPGERAPVQTQDDINRQTILQVQGGVNELRDEFFGDNTGGIL